LDVVDSWDNMETSMLKWKHIVETIMENGHFEYHHNKIGCKNKWGFCLKIHDYMKGITHNEKY
jgi:hypothetical protein